ncbi:hypothetical protein PUN28_020602 [Cardiocondyla obscurior]|uniref:Uncharacterized protein n=1 Tax=Cardiocondyla obscurior TaxID=286306 RepID=A0AAW2E4Q3_9HYME
MHTSLFGAFYFYQKPRYGQKTKKNIFEILQRSIPRYGQKTKKNIFEILQRSIVRQLKKMHTGLFEVFYFYQKPRYGQKTKKVFLKFYNMHLGLFELLFYQKPRYGQKTKKNIFEILQSLCNIQNRCIRLSEPLIFIRSRDMAKNEKNILKFYNIALCGIQNRCIWHCAAIKKSIRAYLSLLFSSEPRYKKTKKFFKFNNVALCNIQNRCIWAYSELFYLHQPRYGQKRKNILKFYNLYFHQQPRYDQKKKNIFKFNNPRYGQKTKIFLKFYNIWPKNEKKNILKFYNVAFICATFKIDIWPKTKKIFLKFYNIALCGIQNRCIWAYSSLIFIRSRDMAKNEKYFEILQRSIVLLFSSEAEGKNEKIFLKFYNFFIFIRSRDMAKNEKNIFEILQPLCGNLKRCIGLFRTFIFIRSRDMAKNEKNIFEILQRSIVRQFKKMHTGLFEPFIFIRSRDMAKNKKNIFEILQRSIPFIFISRDIKKRKNIFKFYNIALHEFGPIRSLFFHQKTSYSQKTKKNIFEILQHSIHCAAFKIDVRAYLEPLFSSEAEIWPKTKIFLKFYNVAFRDMAKNENIFEILQRAFYFHQKPRYCQKTKKNIFEILQRSIQPRYGQKQKNILKFYNIALCGIKIDEFGPIWSLLFSSEAEIWPKNEKKYF